ncbi:MAG: hypothetical protein ACE361_04730 [Aureliella sp.]
MATSRLDFASCQPRKEGSKVREVSFHAGLCRVATATLCRSFWLALLLVPEVGLAQSQGRVARIPAGTLVEDPSAERWNQAVLLARPRIASGDVESLPKSVRDAVSSFVLTILATVARDELSNNYVLKEVGAGYSTYIDGKLTVITSDSQKRLGAGLGFVGGRMLAMNEEQLETALIVARTSNVFVFDAPSLMLQSGEHRPMVTRHFIWVDASSGKLTTLVWLIEGDEQRRRPSQDAIRGFPAGLKEDRKIHVDKSEFLLGGIPTDAAFALESLPPGQAVEWSRAATELAALPAYSREQLQKLSDELNRCIRETLTRQRQSAPSPSP